MEGPTKRPIKKSLKIEEMTKEQIRQAIIKKRECNAKAQSIVESLLEKSIHEDYFLKCLPDINQTHFEDVIEERSILHLCGYPICQKTLLDKDIPKQKYRISMKTNKVYDITVRKSFCSNICYKSAIHIKKQMLTSPLWFREYEVIPKFHLLPVNTTGSMGQEVDLSLTEKIVLKSEGQIVTQRNNDAKATQEFDKSPSNNKENLKKTDNEIELLHSRLNDINIETRINKSIEEPCHKKFKTVDECSTTQSSASNQTTEHLGTDYKEAKAMKKPVHNTLNIVGDIVEKPEKPIDAILIGLSPSSTIEQVNCKKTIQKNKSENRQPPLTVITIEVEKCLAEWFTIDTLLFLFGEEKVKEMVMDKGKCIQDYLNNYSKQIAYRSNCYDQYQALCRKLNMLELEDKRFDTQTLTRETKPLPDYSILKEESKKIQLKVKAFFAGETEIPDENNTLDNNPTDTAPNEENITLLPLIDKNAQNALRRRIVCTHLNKVLPDLLRSLGLTTLTIGSDIHLLVNTFKLNANNIMFKPIQWTFIAIVFIKLLSMRDSRLHHLLKQPMAFKHMQLLLLSYKQDGGYLDRLILWLTDIDRLLDVSDTQLTVE